MGDSAYPFAPTPQLSLDPCVPTAAKYTQSTQILAVTFSTPIASSGLPVGAIKAYAVDFSPRQNQTPGAEAGHVVSWATTSYAALNDPPPRCSYVPGGTGIVDVYGQAAAAWTDYPVLVLA
jgi:hypothetical protein